MGLSGISISRRGRHYPRFQTRIKGGHDSWMLCKLEMIFKDVRVNIISKLKLQPLVVALATRRYHRLFMSLMKFMRITFVDQFRIILMQKN